MGPYGPEVLTYDLVRTVLRDDRFAMPKGIGLAVQGITSGPVWDRVTKLLLSLDGAEHQRLRRLVSQGVHPTRRRTDAHAHASTSSPSWSTAHAAAGSATSSPTSPGRTRFRSSARCSAHPARTGTCSRIGPMTSSKAFGCNVAEDEPAILRAWERTRGLCRRIDQPRGDASLTDDLISELIRAEDDGDRLTHDELVNLAAILLNAGTDTTRNQLAAAVQVLCRSPRPMGAARRPSGTGATSRRGTDAPLPCHLQGLRQAIEDVELGGMPIPAGTFVIANTAAANRDPSVYDDPDRLDITRQCRAGHADLRRRRALLPRRAPCPNRTHRSTACDHPARTQSSPHRPGAMEADHRDIRPDNTSHRIRSQAMRRRVPRPICQARALEPSAIRLLRQPKESCDVGIAAAGETNLSAVDVRHFINVQVSGAGGCSQTRDPSCRFSSFTAFSQVRLHEYCIYAVSVRHAGRGDALDRVCEVRPASATRWCDQGSHPRPHRRYHPVRPATLRWPRAKPDRCVAESSVGHCRVRLRVYPTSCPAASHALTDQRPHRVVLCDGATVQGRTVVVVTGARYRTLNLEILGFAAERPALRRLGIGAQFDQVDGGAGLQDSHSYSRSATTRGNQQSVVVGGTGSGGEQSSCRQAPMVEAQTTIRRRQDELARARPRMPCGDRGAWCQRLEAHRAVDPRTTRSGCAWRPGGRIRAPHPGQRCRPGFLTKPTGVDRPTSGRFHATGHPRVIVADQRQTSRTRKPSECAASRTPNAISSLCANTAVGRSAESRDPGGSLGSILQ